MFTEELRRKFKKDEPIFTEEILSLFPSFSRAQVFRFIKQAIASKELAQFDRGVYYLPRVTFFGLPSSLTSEEVAKKRYIGEGPSVHGLYCGLKLLNLFSLTTQMPLVSEIVSNEETMRRREVEIGGRTFVLHKSRCEINESNLAPYTIMQLFSDVGEGDCFDESARRLLRDYIKKEKISRDQLFSAASFFPGRASKRLIGSGFLDDFA